MLYCCPPCPLCGASAVMDLPREGIVARRNGAMIQDAFPSLSPEDRETVKTGIHPECWDRMFSGVND